MAPDHNRTESIAVGEVVQIPTVPPERIVIFDVLFDPIWREFAIELMIPCPIAIAPTALPVLLEPIVITFAVCE